MNNENFSIEILRKSDEKLFLDIPANTFLIVCPLIPHASDVSNGVDILKYQHPS